MMMLPVGRTLFDQFDLSEPSRWSTLPTVFLSDEMTSICSLICEVSAMFLPEIIENVQRAIS
jgi:hypothetical protein